MVSSTAYNHTGPPKLPTLLATIWMEKIMRNKEIKRTLEFCFRLKMYRISASNTISKDEGIITLSVIEKYIF